MVNVPASIELKIIEEETVQMTITESGTGHKRMLRLSYEDWQSLLDRNPPKEDVVIDTGRL